MTLLYSRRLLIQGGIEKNEKKQLLSWVELLYMRCYAALLLLFSTRLFESGSKSRLNGTNLQGVVKDVS